ncbi:hypothetical protein NYE76_31730 [Paenibacillus sp. FSL M7-0831]
MRFRFLRRSILLLLAFSLVVAALIMNLLQRAEFAVLLLGIIGFGVQVLNRLWFSPGNNPLKHWETVHGLLILHITLANLSFVVYTIAAVFALMYLFLHRKLKGRKWTDALASPQPRRPKRLLCAKPNFLWRRCRFNICIRERNGPRECPEPSAWFFELHGWNSKRSGGAGLFLVRRSSVFRLAMAKYGRVGYAINVMNQMSGSG